MRKAATVTQAKLLGLDHDLPHAAVEETDGPSFWRTISHPQNYCKEKTACIRLLGLPEFVEEGKSKGKGIWTLYNSGSCHCDHSR